MSARRATTGRARTESAPSGVVTARGAAARAAMAIALLHAFNDAYAAFLHPLLPRIMDRLGLSITLAATLATTQTLAASLLQPAMGYLADRYGRRVFIVLGPVLSGVFLSLIGVAPSFAVLVVLLAIGGLGSAAFHPPGASFATRAEHRGSGARFSYFSFGGSVGFALGPLVAVGIVAALGLAGLAVAMVPVLVLAPLLWRALPRGDGRPSRGPPPGPSAILDLLRGPVGLLFGISALATFVQRSFITLQPIAVAEAGGAEALGALSLSVYFGGQAAGTLVGGALADRVDRRRLLTGMTLLALPAHALAVALPPGSAGALTATAAAGMLYMGLFPAIVTLAQEHVPAGTGVSSGIVMGLAWGAGSIGVLGTGALGDAVGAGAAALFSTPAFLIAAVLAARTSRG